MPTSPRWIWIGLCVGVAAAPGFGQAVGHFISDPMHSQGRIDVQATIVTLFVFSGGGQATSRASGSVQVELIPGTGPFEVIIARDLTLAFDDIHMTIPLDSTSPFIPSLPVDVDIRGVQITSTDIVVGVIDAGGLVTFEAAPLRIQADVTFNAGLLGFLEESHDVSATVDLTGEFRVEGNRAELTLNTRLSENVVIPAADLPPAVSEAVFTFTIDLTGLVFAGSVDARSMPGDADQDGDVDLADFLTLVDCLQQSGPGAPAPPGCAVFDFDLDADVDLADLVEFQTHFTGSL